MPPASSPGSRPDVVVAALSARALAAAARRAGWRPAAIDLFADADTRGLADPCIRLETASLRFAPERLLEALDRPPLRGLPLVPGAGFEDDPALLARMALDRPVLGNAAGVVARTKNPFLFAATMERLGIPHPPVARVVKEPDGWLLKRIGGSGGGHVTGASGGTAPPGCYFQRRVEGAAVSVLFLGDGRRAAVIGFSRQWASPTADAPFRYGGAAGPVRLPRAIAAGLCGMADALVDALGLVGLNSADLLLSGREVHLLEVNPRPGASLDVFDRAPMPPLFGLHADACTGRLPVRLPALRGCRAAMVHYAAEPIDIAGPFPWPDWTADRPDGPARIGTGEPVVTILADGASTASARRAAEARRRHLADSLRPSHRPASAAMETTA